MSQNIRYISKSGSDLLAEFLVKDKRLFTYREAARMLGNKAPSREMMASLVKSGWLQRIERGKYLIIPMEAGSSGRWSEHEFVVGSYLVQPYYIGLQSALNYYGYSEKVSDTVYIASTRRKLSPSLQVSGVNYRFIYLKERKFWGFEQVTIDNQKVNLSGREKTIIDCLDFQGYAGGAGAVAQALWYGREEIDFLKLAEYAVRYGSRAVCQRLGYLFETLNADKKRAVAILLKNVSRSYARLDTRSSAQGKYDSRWKIQVNVPEGDLLQWRFD
jgi:predicted transcriptional regulator of viral defense system